jgi:hypothetical protein
MAALAGTSSWKLSSTQCSGATRYCALSTIALPMSMAQKRRLGEIARLIYLEGAAVSAMSFELTQG